MWSGLEPAAWVQVGPLHLLAMWPWAGLAVPRRPWLSWHLPREVTRLGTEGACWTQPCSYCSRRSGAEAEGQDQQLDRPAFKNHSRL